MIVIACALGASACAPTMQTAPISPTDTAAELESALVLDHELAHNVMNHVNANLANTVPYLLLELVFAGLVVNTSGIISKATTSAYSQGIEAEADHVA